MSTANGFATPVSVGISTSAAFTFGDLLGTGKNDILAAVSNVWWRYSWDGSAFVGTSTGITLDAGVQGAWLIDINGDGLPDLVTNTSGTSPGESTQIYARLNLSTAGSLVFSSTESTTTLPPCPAAQSCFPYIQGDGGLASGLRSLDFNGDGMKDLFVQMQHQQTGRVWFYTYSLISNGTSFNVLGGLTLVDTLQSYIFLNANNDACTDVASGTTLTTTYCNGNIGTSITLSGTAIGAMDWDGDGVDDVLVANGTTLGVQESTGTGVTAVINTNFPYVANTETVFNTAPFILDQNGDGLADFGFNVSNGNITYSLHNGASQQPDLATSFVDGYGVEFNPSYQALSDSSYVRGSSKVWPQEDYTGPLYVVPSYTASDG